VEVTGKLCINGEWRDGTGERFEQRNPARLSEVTGRWPLATPAEVDEAIVAAEQEYDSWRRTTAVERADLFRRVLAGIEARRDELAAALTAENGKTLKESHAEIQSGYREMDFQIGEGLRLNGSTTPSINSGVLSYDTRRPLGVVSIISPWNFPFNVPCRKMTPALMAGNTVVFKPSSLTPYTGQLFVELLADAGFPPGVVNYVTGGGSSVGTTLATDPRIRAVSFTGSTSVGEGIHRIGAETMKKTQLEMGGKNPLVVLADADLDAATDAAVIAAYTCAGQWCTATSRLIVESSVHDELLERIVTRVNEYVVGDGAAPGTTMGPVCGSRQAEDISRYIEVGKQEGAKIVAGGSRLTEGEHSDGCFIEPTIFTDVDRDMTIAREEIFGPVLSVLRADDLDHAIELANDCLYGLTSSVYTSDVSKGMRFVQEIESGFTHINLMTAYREPQHPFGGIKGSGYGTPEAGSTGIEFFTEHKVVYIKS
jgi:aldehyde dehydrogenase (NAD+)